MSNSTDHVAQSDIDAKTMEGGGSPVEETAAEVSAPEKSAKFAPEEKMVSLEDLEEEAEYSEKEFQEMLDLYEKTMSDFVEGELVIGKILAVNDKEVAVDIGFKSEGVIPIDEFSQRDPINVGDDIEVFLDNVEDSDGQLVLSKRKADFLRTWERVLESYNNDATLHGICSRRIKGGIVVDLQGVEAFLPGSQIDVRPIRDFDALIGQEMEFKIVKVNEARKNIVVSHRVLIEEGMKEQREKILANLEKGQILEGSVKNITDFGVFIDLGGVDGLLHINDLSWGRVGHPSEIVSLDEKIKIQILDFNEQKDRISLGFKQLQPHPWENVEDKYTEGSTIKGKVVNISDYGAFIELEKGVEGLIHISEMSWTQHIKHPSKVLSLGEIIEAKILNLNVADKKVSLGLKQLEPDPWEDIEKKYPVDSRQKGVVRNLTNFGAFVELEEGIDGLIHISDLSWTKKIRHPGEVVQKGDEVEVLVLNIDKGNRRISLGYKQTMDNPWEVFAQTYKEGAETRGKIVRMIEKGVIVELPEEVDGFVPMSQLKKEGIRKPADGYQVDDELELAVIEFNRDSKKIILSEKLVGTSTDAQLEHVDHEAIAEFDKEIRGGKSAKKTKKAATPDKAAASAPAEKASVELATATTDAEVAEETPPEAETPAELTTDSSEAVEEPAEAVVEEPAKEVVEEPAEAAVDEPSEAADESTDEAVAEKAEAAEETPPEVATPAELTTDSSEAVEEPAEAVVEEPAKEEVEEPAEAAGESTDEVKAEKGEADTGASDDGDAAADEDEAKKKAE